MVARMFVSSGSAGHPGEPIEFVVIVARVTSRPEAGVTERLPNVPVVASAGAPGRRAKPAATITALTDAAMAARRLTRFRVMLWGLLDGREPGQEAGSGMQQR